MAIIVVTLPNTFAPNTLADANQVNANFAAIVNYLNSGSGVSSLAGNGYLVLPSGLILQWGTVTVAGDGSTSSPVTFPLAFTTSALFFAPFNAQYNGTPPLQQCEGIEQAGSRTLNGTVVWASGGTSANVTIPWIAFGV